MDPSKKKFMWSNLYALKMKNILIMCINSIRHFMGLSKLLEHDMNALETFSLTIVLGSV
jgi:fatty-acid desaturase